MNEFIWIFAWAKISHCSIVLDFGVIVLDFFNHSRSKLCSTNHEYTVPPGLLIR